MKLWMWCALLCALAGLSLAAAPAGAMVTERESVSTAGAQADAPSATSVISADGRFVAFESLATTLVPGVTNGVTNIFLRDRQAGTTTRVSIGILGEPDGPSFSPTISSDGRFVAFVSSATNLVVGDTNGVDDIFLWDRTTQAVTRASISSTNFQADGPSLSPSISGDGRFIVFASIADNLVSNDTNLLQDIFLRDTQTGQTTRVSLTDTGGEADGASFLPAISSDGTTVAFASEATNLVVGDTNAVKDIFVRDLVHQTTERVSVGPDDAEANSFSDQPAISSDGRYVAFASAADNLVENDVNGVTDIFVRDRETQETTAVTPVGPCAGECGDSLFPALSADGRYVAFASLASDLVPNDTNHAEDIFLFDRELLRMRRMSEAADGTQADGASTSPSITADGLLVGFTSVATDLVPNDTNTVADVFVHQWITFSDVLPDSFGFDEIEAVAEAGIVEGFPGGTYQPLLVVTRDQMAVFISRAIAGGDKKVPAVTTPPTFPDVPSSFWAFKYIEFAHSHGVVSGFPDGTYHPADPVDRGGMAVFIARAIAGGDAGVPSGPASPSFPDVPTDFWAFKYIEFLHTRNIVQGFPDGTYQPAMAVTRDQMAVFIARAFNLTAASLSAEAALPEEGRDEVKRQ